jgi:hypothetical protein
MITPSGRVRDTVYFSIIAGEWARVKHALEARLQRAPAAPLNPHAGAPPRQ